LRCFLNQAIYKGECNTQSTADWRHVRGT
jgi:hypothetical protein